MKDGKPRLEPAAQKTDSFVQAVAKIEFAYRSLGHTPGWRFLTGPEATLSSGVDIGFVTLNPGNGRWGRRSMKRSKD